MAEDADRARMDALEARLAKAQAQQAPPERSESGHAQGEIAWRMVTELVAGLLIGFGIGYGLDTLFGTMPIFLVLFIMLGFAAGIKVMMRSAAELTARSAAPQGAEGDERD
ncbi:F0F1 ATP synthase subunit I [Mesobaculum littorinae]|uniref:ATP synthase protein I n=1 Tax=Mesobaculum littorinae TaxID=2486419 RepID=A0A438AEG1_9RHOB|nr:AtpZ/AtpI family protein [Mesobaculum littorinae]RVV97052.1 F0F1 ATP synthase subunit I [Mesobaculum littorinae]